MGVFTSENEFVSTISPARLYKALALDSKNVFPKALPYVHDVEILEGDGGPGTIKNLILPGGGYVKHRVEVNDINNYLYHYTVIEGGYVVDKLEKVSNEYKLAAAPDGGTIIKYTLKYYTKNDEQLAEEYFKVGKQQINGFLKAIEDYLVANPDYN